MVIFNFEISQFQQHSSGEVEFSMIDTERVSLKIYQ